MNGSGALSRDGAVTFGLSKGRQPFIWNKTSAIRILELASANPAVRTRKHEVVSCSVAVVSNRLLPSKIA